MKKIYLLLGVIALFGCRSIKPIDVIGGRTDSVRVEVRESKIVEYVKDTIYLNVPVESKQQIKKDSSHLETSFAISDANITDDGLINHTLENKTQDKPRVVEIPIVTIEHDSIYFESSSDSIYVDKPYKVEVKKPLRWYEKLLMGIGLLTIGGLVAYCFVKLRKVL